MRQTMADTQSQSNYARYKGQASPSSKQASMRDSRLSQTGVSLNAVRKQRQNMETDVMQMHNRIKMLQLEEDKALKKIEETRTKAKRMIEFKLA